MSQKESSRKLFQIILSHLWAQNFYETWTNKILLELEDEDDSTNHLLKIFYRLECIRLDYCIQRDLPGLWAQQKLLRI